MSGAEVLEGGFILDLRQENTERTEKKKETCKQDQF